MATQLFGRADAALANAAYKAAKANAPKDLAPMHARMAASYKTSVDSTAELFGQIGKVIGKEGAKLIRAAKEFNSAARGVDDFNSKKEYKQKVTEEVTQENTQGDVLPEGGTDGDYNTEQQAIIDAMKDPNISKVEYEELLSRYEAGDYGNTAKVQVEEPYTGDYKVSDLNNNEEVVQPMTIREQLKSIRKEWWNMPKDWTKEQKKDRREELRIKKNNIKASVLEFETFNNLAIQHLSADNINISASTPAKLKFSQALLSGGKPLDDDSRAIVGFTEEGHMTFMYVDGYGKPITDENGEEISVQASNIENLLTPKNPVARGIVNEVTNAQTQLVAGSKGLSFDANAINSLIAEQVTDVATARDLAFYQSPNSSTSLAGKLHNTNMFSNGETGTSPNAMSAGVFGSLNTEIWDTNDDNVINADDFSSESYATTENYKKLVDHILSGKDLDLTKQFLKNHLVEEAKVYHQQGLDRYNEAKRKSSGGSSGKGGGGSTFELFGNTYRNPSTEDEREELDSVLAIAKGQSRVEIKDEKYVLDGNTGYYKAVIPFAGEENIRYSRTQLTQMASNYYGAPNDFDWSGGSTAASEEGKEGALNQGLDNKFDDFLKKNNMTQVEFDAMGEKEKLKMIMNSEMLKNSGNYWADLAQKMSESGDENK